MIPPRIMLAAARYIDDTFVVVNLIQLSLMFVRDLLSERSMQSARALICHRATVDLRQQ